MVTAPPERAACHSYHVDDVGKLATATLAASDDFAVSSFIISSSSSSSPYLFRTPGKRSTIFLRAKTQKTENSAYVSNQLSAGRATTGGIVHLLHHPNVASSFKIR